MTAYQAHREGIPKLREWEADDFNRARNESRMRLFDDEMEDMEDTGDGGPRGKGVGATGRSRVRPAQDVYPTPGRDRLEENSRPPGVGFVEDASEGGMPIADPVEP